MLQNKQINHREYIKPRYFIYYLAKYKNIFIENKPLRVADVKEKKTHSIVDAIWYFI